MTFDKFVKYAIAAFLVIGGGYVALLFIVAVAVNMGPEFWDTLSQPGPKTVADMTPHQLYGLIVMSQVAVVGLVIMWRNYTPELHPYGKFIVWAGSFFMVGIPIIFGLSALNPS